MPQPTVWRYALRLRPLSFCTAPKGWTAFGSTDGRHGWVGYDRELTLAEAKGYELDPLDADSMPHGADLLEYRDSRASWWPAYEYIRDNAHDCPNILSECDDLGGDYKAAADIYRARYL
jgi:hypothetical protein